MTEELHLLDRNSAFMQHAHAWFDAILVVFALLLILALVRVQDEAVTARDELAQRKAVVCPTELDGRKFVFSGYESINLYRPGTSRLICYYKREK